VPLHLFKAGGSVLFIATGQAGQDASGYTGIALNTALRRMTTLSGMAINSLALLNGRMLAVTDGALFELTGDDDDGAEIEARAVTHATDFGQTERKRMAEVLVGYRCAGDLRLTVTVNEHEEHEYVMEAPGHEELSTGRVKIGKGVDGRWWQFGVENLDGCDFALSAFEANGATLSRRVG
jgi:hypothetical protein